MSGGVFLQNVVAQVVPDIVRDSHVILPILAECRSDLGGGVGRTAAKSVHELDDYNCLFVSQSDSGKMR